MSSETTTCPRCGQALGAIKSKGGIGLLVTDTCFNCASADDSTEQSAVAGPAPAATAGVVERPARSSAMISIMVTCPECGCWTPLVTPDPLPILDSQGWALGVECSHCEEEITVHVSLDPGREAH